MSGQPQYRCMKPTDAEEVSRLMRLSFFAMPPRSMAGTG